jgi:hypothetical protein
MPIMKRLIIVSYRRKRFMFKNEKFEGIHYSRFVVSFAKAGGRLDYRFRDWLEQLIINGKNIPSDIIDDIYNYGTCGKLELEGNAKLFLKKPII